MIFPLQSSPEPQYSNVKSEPTLDGKHSPEVVKAHISLLNHSSLPSSPVNDMGSTSVGADGEVAMAPGSKRKLKVQNVDGIIKVNMIHVIWHHG